MKEGDRVYYTGDMANCSSEGTITRIRPASKFGPVSVDISFDEERFEGDTRKTTNVYIQMFDKGPGQRFWMLEDWEADRQRRIKEMKERFLELQERGKI